MYSLEKYRIFFQAARFENFTQAARELFVTQSSVSQAVRALEESLGVALFTRLGKKVQLTEEGRLLYRELEQAFGRIKRAEEVIEEVTKASRGSLTIGASDTLCRHYLLGIFAAFRKSYPSIHLSLVNRPSPSILEELHRGTVDIGFASLSEKKPRALTAKPLLPMEEVFFTGEDFAFLSMKKQTLQSLLDFPWVSLGTHTSTRQLLEDLFERNNLSWKPSVEVISIDLLIDLVASGFGIGFAPRRIVQKAGLFEIEVQEKFPQRSLSLLYNPTLPMSIAAEKFLEIGGNGENYT